MQTAFPQLPSRPLDNKTMRFNYYIVKRIPLLLVLFSLCVFLFSQNLLDLGIGYQYGMANVFDSGETLRKIKEPGVVATLRILPENVGIYGRIGLLFPSKVTEGSLTLTYNDYNYILFLNGGVGFSVNVPLGRHFSLFFDIGISINDLLYGGSYTDTIDATWNIKLHNLGTTIKGGYKFENVKMKESYNDVSFGILGNPALRFKYGKSLYMELGAAVSFDFLRTKSYKFSADLSRYSYHDIKNAFPAGKLDDPDEPKELILEKNSQFSVFKQFTFIPSISLGFSM